MNKQYFENEEEAYKVFDDLLGEFDFDDNIFTRDLVDAAKKNGYIKQSDLEKAKKDYETISHPGVNITAHEYIKELQKEIERLNK